MMFIEFVTLHSNLLLCWHGFRNVIVNVAPNIIHDQLLIWTTRNQFTTETS